LRGVSGYGEGRGGGAECGYGVVYSGHEGDGGDWRAGAVVSPVSSHGIRGFGNKPTDFPTPPKAYPAIPAPRTQKPAAAK